MKIIKLSLIIALSAIVSNQSFAAERIGHHSIKEALERGYEEGIIDKDIPVYFKGQSRPKYGKVIGTYNTSKKTKAFKRSDSSACQWAFLSALKVLIERARKEGGKAVIDIVSNYKHKVYKSATEFECGAGNIIAGVALKGKVVK